MITLLVIVFSIWFIYGVLAKDICPYCNKYVWHFQKYYSHKWTIDDLFVCKNKQYFASKCHARCCERNEPYFNQTTWDEYNIKQL